MAQPSRCSLLKTENSTTATLYQSGTSRTILNLRSQGSGGEWIPHSTHTKKNTSETHRIPVAATTSTRTAALSMTAAAHPRIFRLPSLNTPLSPLCRGVVATCAGASPKRSFVERGLVVDADSSGRSMLPSSEGRGFTQQMMNNRSMGYTGACQFHTRQAGLLADDDKISGARKPESKGMSVTCKRKHQRRQGKGASESLLFCYDAESLQTKWLQ